VPPESDDVLPSAPLDDPSPELPELLAAPVVALSPEHATISAKSRPGTTKRWRTIEV
jgi:hypothetical protein